MIGRLFSFKRGRKREQSSTPLAICSVLSAKELSLLLESATDWRTLLEQAAALKRAEIGTFGAKIAGLLGLEFLKEVPKFDHWLLPKKFGIEDFRSCAAAPIFHEGILTGLVCVDPARLDELGKSFPGLPRYISSWSEIEKALNNTVKQLDSGIVGDRVSYLISLVVQEARSYGAETVILSFSAREIEYRFVTIEGRTGKGALSNTLKFPILSRLNEIISNEGQSVDLKLDLQRVQIRVRALSNVEFELQIAGGDRPTVNPLIKPPSNPTVALIDDDRNFAMVVARFFERVGIRVIQIFHADKAVAEIKNTLPQAVICDLHMPGKSGFELLEQIRADGDLKKLPFIMLTSDENIETEIQAVGKGVDAFVNKDEEPLLLAAHVQKLLSAEAQL